MPNKTAHRAFNALLGLLSGLAVYHGTFNVLIFTVLCVVTARLPDYIEKPKSKTHRGFYHSWTAFIGSLVIFILLSTSPISGLAYGYSLHILLDKARTKSFTSNFSFKSRNKESVKPGEED